MSKRSGGFVPPCWPFSSVEVDVGYRIFQMLDSDVSLPVLWLQVSRGIWVEVAKWEGRGLPNWKLMWV